MPETVIAAERVASRKRFFHWELEFPDVFNLERRGFDAVLGNPPWDIAKPNSKEFFSNIDPLYRSYGKQDATDRQKEYFADLSVETQWLDYNSDFRAQSNHVSYASQSFGDPERVTTSEDRFTISRSGATNAELHQRWRKARGVASGFADTRHPFRHQGSADLNLFKLFLEQAHALLRPAGRLGFIVPSGLYSDHGTRELRRLFMDRCRWEWLFNFINWNAIFPSIYYRFKFNVIVLQKGVRGEQIRLDPAIGTTTPDVIYRAMHHGPDEGVSIYLDGMSGHFHGNAATADRDRAIRTWLRNNGWEVIDIAANELHDQGAMQRHFRRLASYLRADEVRARVHADTSWFARAERTQAPSKFVPRMVRPTPAERFTNCVPLVPLKAAAGWFSNPQNVGEAAEWEWTQVDSRHRLRPGMFVAQVVGKSMEPQIPDGAYCLFATPVEGSRQGKTVLVALNDKSDPETGQRYTVKKYESGKATADDGTWRHVTIRLKPNNPDFTPIELTTDDEGAVRVVAEVVEVLR